MKKTIAVNISGIIFNIEEDAYEKLKKYLSTIRGYFSTTDSKDEIIDDIEIRIAELFQERVKPSKEAITLNDVNDVIGIMGEPEDYLDDDLGSSSSFERETPYETAYQSTGKKLFRDKDHRIVGGVCAGIAAYFNIDTVWIRLILVISVIFFGFGILPYVILWAIIPEAKTTSDKIRMHGDPVTVDSIKKKVDEGLIKFEEGTKNMRKTRRSSSIASFISNLVDLTLKAIVNIFKVIGYIVGFFFLLLGLALIVGLVMAFFDSTQFISHSMIFPFSIGDIMGGLFSSTLHGNMFLFGLVLLMGIPVIAMILVGLRLIFRFQWPHKGIGAAMVTAWFIGLFITIFSSINLSSEFKYEDDITNKESIEISADTLAINLLAPPLVEGNVQVNGIHVSQIKMEDGLVTFGNAYLDIVSVPANEPFGLHVERSSQGSDYEDVAVKMNNIEYEFIATENALSIDPRFTFPEDDKFRNQQVKFILSVPIGKYVYLEDKLHMIIDNMDKKTRSSRRGMMDHYWMMSEDGLIDINEDYEEEEEEEDYEGEEDEEFEERDDEEFEEREDEEFEEREDNEEIDVDFKIDDANFNIHFNRARIA